MPTEAAKMSTLSAGQLDGIREHIAANWRSLAVGTLLPSVCLYLGCLLLLNTQSDFSQIGWGAWIFLLCSSACYLGNAVFRPQNPTIQATIAEIIAAGGLMFFAWGLLTFIYLAEARLLTLLPLLFITLVLVSVGKFFFKTSVGMLTECLKSIGRKTYRLALKGLALAVIGSLAIRLVRMICLM
jgi:hypothetical protein